MKRVELCLLDPQNDFCLPQGSVPLMPSGAFLVSGADGAMKRIARWITDQSDRLADIHLTLDSHHKLDLCHPSFWRNSQGNHPFGYTAAMTTGRLPTIISSTDISRGIWVPMVPSLSRRMIAYTSALEKQGKFLSIWDEHCLIGTPGAAVVAEVMTAVNHWAVSRGATVDFITKGSNVFTEHVGAFEADVPDPQDPTTHLNMPLIATLEEADVLVWASGAPTNCAISSMRQVFDNFSITNIAKSVLLIDVMPCPREWEGHLRQFIDEYANKGLQIETTTELII